MLKVLLVDDEPFILQGLSVLIDWNAEGFEIAGMVDSAEKALEILLREQIDLVCTDVRMPQMSGLDLLEKVRHERLANAFFIIFSGFSDFDYVKTALKFGSIDYLLKPIDKEELVRALGRVRTFRQERSRRQQESAAVEGARKGLAGLFQRFEQWEKSKETEVSSLKASGANINKKAIDELVRAVEINQKEEIAEGTRNVYHELAAADDAVVDMAVNYLFFELLHLATEVDAGLDQQEVLHYITQNAFEGKENEDDEENLERMMTDYSEYLAELRGNRSVGVLGQIEAELKERYAENITLKELSKKYFINTAYLGQIFRKQYGESFKDYLKRIRIEKAEELLMHSDKKVYEIAQEVGYKDMDYFINSFITVRGCTPAKFRKQIRQ